MRSTEEVFLLVLAVEVEDIDGENAPVEPSISLFLQMCRELAVVVIKYNIGKVALVTIYPLEEVLHRPSVNIHSNGQDILKGRNVVIHLDSSDSLSAKHGGTSTDDATAVHHKLLIMRVLTPKLRF